MKTHGLSAEGAKADVKNGTRLTILPYYLIQSFSLFFIFPVFKSFQILLFVPIEQFLHQFCGATPPSLMVLFRFHSLLFHLCFGLTVCCGLQGRGFICLCALLVKWLFDYQVPLVVTIQLMSGSSSGVDGIKTDGCSLLFFIAYLPPPSPLNEFQGQRDKT